MAIDEMPASRLLLEYVTDLAQGRSDFRVHLFHAVGIPPGLLESPGAEHPAEQKLVQEKLEQRQQQWHSRTRSEAESHFETARAALTAANVPDSVIETHLGVLKHGDHLPARIIKAAREHDCGTIVVAEALTPGSWSYFRRTRARSSSPPRRG